MLDFFKCFCFRWKSRFKKWRFLFPPIGMWTGSMEMCVIETYLTFFFFFFKQPFFYSFLWLDDLFEMLSKCVRHNKMYTCGNALKSSFLGLFFCIFVYWLCWVSTRSLFCSFFFFLLVKIKNQQTITKHALIHSSLFNSYQEGEAPQYNAATTVL